MRLSGFKFLTIIIFISILFSFKVFHDLNFSERLFEKRLLIGQGQGIKQISGSLFNDNPPLKLLLILNLYYEAKVNKKYVIPGEYSFKGKLSLRKIVNDITTGNRVIRKIVIPEGFNIYQIKIVLKNSEGLFGAIPTEIEEGSLMPDTYYYFWGDKYLELIRKMKVSMDSFVEKNFKSTKLISDINKLLTLASIVEKETSYPQERPIIAGVYLNRLRIGMILQADPTVIYGITNGETDFNYLLTKADLLSPSPFNTYLVKGLPPKPIGCPGKASILAVINPTITDNYYFVADGNGKHNFASNLSGHNNNVLIYRNHLKSAEISWK